MEIDYSRLTGKYQKNIETTVWKEWNLTKQSPTIFRSETTIGLGKNCEVCSKDFGVFFFLLPQTYKLIGCHIRCLSKNIHYIRNKTKINYQKNKGKYNHLQEKYTRRKRDMNTYNKKIIIDHYTNGKRECACCGYKGIEFLTVDHMNNDGASHRKRVGNTGIYKDIITNNFPKDIQILCFNCNYAKHHNGGLCPHLFMKISKEKILN